MIHQYLTLPLEVRSIVSSFLEPEVERRKNGTVKLIWIGNTCLEFYRNGRPRIEYEHIEHGGDKLKEFYSNGRLRYDGHGLFGTAYYNGFGRLYRQDGTLHYVGNFEDGLFSGDGYYFFRDGTCVHANFRSKNDHWFFTRRNKRGKYLFRKRYDYNAYIKRRFKTNKPIYLGYKGN